MAKCNFSITFMQPVPSLIENIKSTIEGQGGSFNGDENTGQFEVSMLGALSGSYNISGQQINIAIDNKPIFVSCSQIENFLKDKLSK